MNDLVYRKDAISALGEKPLAWTESEYETGLQNQWEFDIASIRSIPSNNIWIPCSKELPKNEGVYIVTYRVSWDSNEKPEAGSCYFDGTEWHGVFQDIIAWMPLPQVYEEV